MPRKRNCKHCGKSCYSRSEVPFCRLCSLKMRTIHHDRVKYKRYYALHKKYGLDEDGFLVLWEAFMGKCGICETQLTMPENTRGQPLTTVCVDHDHTTGNLRGLLCNACNKALGLFKDNPILLNNALKWVRK